MSLGTEKRPLAEGLGWSRMAKPGAPLQRRPLLTHPPPDPPSQPQGTILWVSRHCTLSPPSLALPSASLK